MERHLPACGGVVFDDQGYLSRFLAQAAEEEETIAEMTFLHLRFGPAELRGLEFAHCRFEGCSFAGCRMDRLYLKESVLEQCDLSGWTAADATFASVVWQDCRLSGAQLSGSVFRDLNSLRNARLLLMEAIGGRNCYRTNVLAVRQITSHIADYVQKDG